MVALSGVMAMSSTAMVVKMMAERLSWKPSTASASWASCSFQDLAVVPLLVVIPALGSSTSEMIPGAGWPSGKAALVLFVLLAVGPRLMQWWLHRVVRTQSNELFMLNLLLGNPGPGLADRTGRAEPGAGCVRGRHADFRNPYKHQVETDIRPFHDVLWVCSSSPLA